MHDILTYPSGDLPKSKVRALEFIKGGWSGQGFILGPWSFGLVCVFLPISVFFLFFVCSSAVAGLFVWQAP